MVESAKMFDPIDPEEPEPSACATSGGVWKPDPFLSRKPTAEELRHPTLGRHSAGPWLYRDAKGQPVGYIVRFDPPGQRKQFLPLRYGTLDGREGFHWKGWSHDRPPYRLPELMARADATVLVVEGEKAVGAAQQRFPEFVVTTSMGGANAASKTDWAALKGYEVIIFPDADAPGVRYASDVAKLAREAGATSIRIVTLPTETPEGWDLADPLPQGWTEHSLRQMLDDAVAIEFSEAAPTDAWPALVRLDAPELPDVTCSVLPGFAGAFSAALAEATETPPALAVALVLAVCATAAARRFRVLVSSGYFEPTNLWMAVALAPGNRKSAVQSAATAPLLAWERERAKAMEDEIRRATSERRTQEARVKEVRAKAARSDDDIAARELARQAADIEADLTEIPRVPQLWTSDATPERMGSLLADNEERLAWLSSEGGVFELLSGRYSGGIPNLDLVLKAHSGDAERVDRGSRPPVYLAHPLLTIGISPQPDVLRGLASKPGFRGRGLLGRFLYFLPVSPLGWRTLNPKPMSPTIEAAYVAGVAAILNMPSAVDGDGKDVPQLLRLSPEASQEWREFALDVETRMRPGGDFETANDWAGKAPGAAARLAGVLHVIEHAHGSPAASPISLETMERALELIAVIAQHSLHALDLMGADETIASARRVWSWIEAGRREQFAIRDAHQALKGTFPRVADLREALDVLEERGYLEIIEPRATGRGRPPSPNVTVRPDLVRGWK